MKFGCNLQEVCISAMMQTEHIGFILFTKGTAQQTKLDFYPVSLRGRMEEVS